MTAPSLPVRIGKLPDIELARRWVTSVSGEVHFSSDSDKQRGEFFHYVTEKEQNGQKRCRVQRLQETEVESRILAFLLALADTGANIRITTAKIKSVRNLGALLMMQGGQSK